MQAHKFSVLENLFGEFTEYRLINNQTQEYVSVIPAFGALLNQVALAKKGKVYELLVGAKTYEELDVTSKRLYRGSKLLPFANRINHGIYTFNGNTYHLHKNFEHEDNAIHGLVTDKKFEVVSREENEDSASVTVKYSYNGDIDGYPFKYTAHIFYKLSDDGFENKTRVKNDDDKEIPVSDGWHPYFNAGQKLDKLLFKIPESSIIEVDERLIPTSQVTEFNKFKEASLFGDQKFDTCFDIRRHEGSRIAVEVVNLDEKIRIRMWQDTGKNQYNFVQIYTPPHRNFVAIEPMSSAPDAFNNKNGLIVLQPAEEVELIWGIQLQEYK